MEKISMKVEETLSIFSLLDKVVLGILLLLVFLLPIFFIPSTIFAFPFVKTVLLSTLCLSAFGLWIVARLREGKISLPKNLLFLSLGVLLIILFLSAVFSMAPRTSLIGNGFEVDTVGIFAVLFVGFFVVSSIFQNKSTIFYFYLAFFASFILVAIFQFARLFSGGSFLSAFFGGATGNLIGKWNDLGIYAGLAALLALVTLQSIELNALFRRLLYVILALALLLLVGINFFMLWIVLGIFSLLFTLLVVRERKIAGVTSKIRLIPILPAAVFLLSILFLFLNGPVSALSASKLNIIQNEIRPSWRGTFEIMRGTFKKSPVLGAGPNRFFNEWTRIKPAAVNQTPYWNVDFAYGVGIIPTSLITGGILGILGWLTFLVVYLYKGIRASLRVKNDGFSHYLVISSFFGSAFLWTFAFVYIPSTVVLAATFLLTGIFAGALYHEGTLGKKEFSFADYPKAGFAAIVCLILFFIGSVALGYLFIEKTIASAYFQRGAIAYNSGQKIEAARSDISRAANIVSDAMYLRPLVEVDLLDLNQILTNKTLSPEVLRDRFQTALNGAIAHAERAVKSDPTDYRNFISLGSVYEFLVPMKFNGAYENAMNAYERARELNPFNPAIFLLKARTEVEAGNNVRARAHLQSALVLRPIYTEAIFLLSQIEVKDGNIKTAIQTLSAAVQTSPRDFGLLFELGLLKYNQKDYAGAAEAFQYAIKLNPAFANAKYFLGLSYDKLGRRKDALTQFEDLAKTNPDNQEIKSILTNLRAGKSASQVTDSPTKAESRKNLPVKEK